MVNSRASNRIKSQVKHFFVHIILIKDYVLMQRMFLFLFDKMLVLYMTQNGNTVELGDKELFGHPKIVP